MHTIHKILHSTLKLVPHRFHPQMAWVFAATEVGVFLFWNYFFLLCNIVIPIVVGCLVVPDLFVFGIMSIGILQISQMASNQSIKHSKTLIRAVEELGRNKVDAELIRVDVLRLNQNPAFSLHTQTETLALSLSELPRYISVFSTVIHTLFFITLITGFLPQVSFGIYLFFLMFIFGWYRSLRIRDQRVTLKILKESN